MSVKELNKIDEVICPCEKQEEIIASEIGENLKCPKCNELGQIYHLSWSALQCQNCKTMIDKFDWLIEKGKYSKN